MVVENWPNSHGITFLKIYRLVYKIPSHFNKLILVWSTYYRYQDRNTCGRPKRFNSRLSLIYYLKVFVEERIHTSYSVDTIPYSNGNNAFIEDAEAKGKTSFLFLTGFQKANLLLQLKTVPSKIIILKNF